MTIGLEYSGGKALFGIRPRDGRRILSELEAAHESESLRLEARLETERQRREALRAEVVRLEETITLQEDLWKRLDDTVVQQPPSTSKGREPLFSMPEGVQPQSQQTTRHGFTVIGARQRDDWSPGRVGNDGAEGGDVPPRGAANRQTAVYPSNAVKRRSSAAGLGDRKTPPVAQSVMRYLEGKVVGADLQRVDGRMLAERGTPITRDIVEEATRHGVLSELILGMRFPDEMSD